MRYAKFVVGIIVLVSMSCAQESRVKFLAKTDQVDILIDDHLASTWLYRSDQLFQSGHRGD